MERSEMTIEQQMAFDKAQAEARHEAIRKAVVADFTKNGGQVSAIILNFPDGRSVPLPGANLLDYFAGKAMAGILTSDDCITQNAAEVIAETAYRCAAAMLKEREKYNKKKGKPDA